MCTRGEVYVGMATRAPHRGIDETFKLYDSPMKVSILARRDDEGHTQAMPSTEGRKSPQTMGSVRGRLVNAERIARDVERRRRGGVHVSAPHRKSKARHAASASWERAREHPRVPGADGVRTSRGEGLRGEATTHTATVRSFRSVENNDGATRR